MEKKENKKQISLLTLSSVHEKALGKDGVCRVAYLGHSSKSFMAPPIVYDLEMGKNKKGLPSACDLALAKPVVCRVSELGHSANSFTGPTHAQ